MMFLRAPASSIGSGAPAAGAIGGVAQASIDDNCSQRTNGRLFVIVLLGAFARYLLTEPRTC
jgi:hypothetical protein